MIDRGKRSKTLTEVKPVENINKNLQSFSEITPVQKEVLLSHKPRDHLCAYELSFLVTGFHRYLYQLFHSPRDITF